MGALFATFVIIAVFISAIWFGTFFGGLVMGLWDSKRKEDYVFIFSDLEPAEKFLFFPFFITYVPIRKMLG